MSFSNFTESMSYKVGDYVTITTPRFRRKYWIFGPRILVGYDYLKLPVKRTHQHSEKSEDSAPSPDTNTH